MALYEAFEVIGHIELEKDRPYTTADIPDDMEVLVLNDSGFIYGKVRDSNGDHITKDGVPQYARTNIRGVRYRVVKTGITYPVNSPNVLGIWEVGQVLAFSPDSTYTFYNTGIIAYGLKVSV